MEQLIGQIVDGKYRVEQKLGQGGMGAVYRATHLGTTRPVALKVITPQFMANPEFVERFKREAKTAGLLMHPNVVNVTDFGFADVGSDRIAYLVMEYLHGRTLADVLAEKQRLSLTFTVDLIEQTCLAVGEAHKRNIIHRDLKPDNIWLEPNGRGGFNVKVLDFGLAKLRDDESSEHEPTALLPSFADIGTTTGETLLAGSTSAEVVPDTSVAVAGSTPAAARVAGDTHASDRITRVGTVLGTPVYMSPEQCRGDRLDTRSDIYSLGVIAYQMLTGRSPFRGDPQSLIVQHVTASPPPFESDDVPESVEAVVLQALAKSPEERPASAMVFASAMRAQSEGVGVVLRQAFALYSEHFPAFVRIARFGYAPTFVIGVLLMLLTFTLGVRNPYVLGAFPFVVYAGIYFLFTTTRAGVALVLEQLLVSPLSPVEPDAIISRIGERLGVARTGGELSWRLRIYATLAELTITLFSSPIMPAGVLAVAAFVVEGGDHRRARARSRLLTNRLRTVLRGIQVMAAVTFLTSGFVMFLAIFGLVTFFGLDRLTAISVSVIAALIVLSLNSIWLVSPVVIALTMLYFRSRQAGGEELAELPDAVPTDAPI